MPDRIAPPDYLLSGQTTSGVGNIMDCRLTTNAGYFSTWTPANSALVVFQASPDGVTGWSTIALVTATTTIITAQYSAFFPYVRGVVNVIYGAASGYMHYAPARG